MKNTHWMVRLVQIVAGLFVFFGCLVMLIYSPFYSQLVVKGLNRFVSFEINEVAAQSQKMASLSEDDTLEPGSDQWIARQAYFRVMEQDIQKNHSANLMLIQARYKILQQMIEEHQREQQEEKQNRISLHKCLYCPSKNLLKPLTQLRRSANCWSGTVMKTKNALSNILNS